MGLKISRRRARERSTKKAQKQSQNIVTTSSCKEPIYPSYDPSSSTQPSVHSNCVMVLFANPWNLSNTILEGSQKINSRTESCDKGEEWDRRSRNIATCNNDNFKRHRPIQLKDIQNLSTLWGDENGWISLDDMKLMEHICSHLVNTRTKTTMIF